MNFFHIQTVPSTLHRFAETVKGSLLHKAESIDYFQAYSSKQHMYAGIVIYYKSQNQMRKLLCGMRHKYLAILFMGLHVPCQESKLQFLFKKQLSFPITKLQCIFLECF